MNLAKIVSRRQRIMQYLLFFGTAIAVVVGLAQTQEQNSDRILIDGKDNPDQIPDCILWAEVFQIAAQLDENSLIRGQEFWIQKLNLPEEVAGEIIAQGYEHRKMLQTIDKEAQKQISDSNKADSDLKDHPNKKEALKSKLVKIQLNKEARTLEMRDELRERIGEDAFLRLSSFARLQIATKTKIGN